MNWKRDRRTYWLILVGLTCFNWLSAVAGSSNQPPKPVYLTLRMLVPGTDVVRINTPDLFTLRPVDLLSQPLNPTGLTQVNLQLASPQFVDLVLGQRRCPLLLSPGDSLQLIVDATAATPIRFTGPGATVARLLGELDSLRQAYEQQAGQPGRALSPQAFINRLDSLQQACRTRLAMVTNGRPAQQQLLTRRCQVQQLRYQLEYALANSSSASIASVVALPKLLAQVPLDTQLLTAHVYEYGLILHQLLQAGYYQSLLQGRTMGPLLEAGDEFPRVVDQQLQQAGYPQPIETFLRASNLASAIQKQGTSPLTDSLRASLRQQHTFTGYQPTIEQLYAHWQPLRRGQPAPLIRGLTPDGKLFSVSQLKGKPVYVDVWASWCIPCRQGLAQTSQLRKQLPADAVLVYVSIDRDPRAWQAFLRANPNLGGIHLNQPPGPDFDAFAQAYQLGAIPRYILIDKTGRLVNATAPPPASTRLSQLIAQLP